mmetsp:Transcript_25504/g.52581  ORF Transcript_25504/g.52581 Transcript_25504/m.52581 type:complete len:142 (+) Transcript_25504:1004-1429(+)
MAGVVVPEPVIGFEGRSASSSSAAASSTVEPAASAAAASASPSPSTAAARAIERGIGTAIPSSFVEIQFLDKVVVVVVPSAVAVFGSEERRGRPRRGQPAPTAMGSDAVASRAAATALCSAGDGKAFDDAKRRSEEYHQRW